MSANQFGNVLKFMSFGESHGPALGIILDGCPSGLFLDHEFLQAEMDRRRPGFQDGVSQRREADQVEILSGVYEGVTLGTPIAMIVRNIDKRSADYDEIKSTPRTGHADAAWKGKFVQVDHRGGGRSSGRETVSRVMAGAVAKMLLRQWLPGFKIEAYASQIGSLKLTKENYSPSQVEQYLSASQAQGQSHGGIATLSITGIEAGLGQPVFHKLKSDLAMAMMSLGATCGFEIGQGFDSVESLGTDFHQDKAGTQYGGISGGISTGDEILLRVGFKPTSSILDIAKKGRHDPCIVLRALPVIEAMAAFVLADHALWRRCDNI